MSKISNIHTLILEFKKRLTFNEMISQVQSIGITKAQAAEFIELYNYGFKLWGDIYLKGTEALIIRIREWIRTNREDVIRRVFILAPLEVIIIHLMLCELALREMLLFIFRVFRFGCFNNPNLRPLSDEVADTINRKFSRLIESAGIKHAWNEISMALVPKGIGAYKRISNLMFSFCPHIDLGTIPKIKIGNVDFSLLTAHFLLDRADSVYIELTNAFPFILLEDERFEIDTPFNIRRLYQSCPVTQTWLKILLITLSSLLSYLKTDVSNVDLLDAYDPFIYPFSSNYKLDELPFVSGTYQQKKLIWLVANMTRLTSA